MTEDLENIEGQEQEIKPLKKKSPLRRFLRMFMIIFLWSFGSVTLLIILSLLLYQTSAFRSAVNGIIIGLINQELIGKIEIDDFIIKPFKGIEIINIKVLSEGDIVASASKIELDFKFSPLLKNKAIITKFIIEEPYFNLVRGKDSVWNISKIAKPSDDTTVSEIPDWIIELRNFEIRNGKFNLFDYLSSDIEKKSLNFNNLKLENIWLSMSAFGNLSENKYQNQIYHFSFRDNQSGFALKRINSVVELDTNKINIPEFTIETNNSKIKLSAKVDSINILGKDIEKKIETAPISFSLIADSINLKDLTKFTDIKFENGNNITCNINLNGNLNNIAINNFSVRAFQNEINFSGKLKNISIPEKSSYSISLDKTNFAFASIVKYLPTSAKATFPKQGNLIIKKLDIEGTPDSINADLDISGDMGNIKGKVSLGIGNILIYNIDLLTENLNLTDILNNNEINGNITANINVKGSGTNLKNLNLASDIRASHTQFSGYSFHDFIYKGSITKGKIFRLDTLLIKLDDKKKDSINPYKEGLSTVFLTGSLDLSNQKKPIYDISAYFKDLNISELTDLQSAPQILSGHFSLNGNGFHPDSIECDFKSFIDMCMFGDRALLPFGMDILIQRVDDGARNIKIESDLMNIDLAGQFYLTNILSMLKNQGTYFINYIVNKVNTVSSDYTKIEYNNLDDAKISQFAPIDLKLNAKVKDLSTIRTFLGDADIACRANIGMTLMVNDSTSKLTIDSINVTNFQYIDPYASVVIKPLNLTLDMGMSLIDSLPHLENLAVELKSFGNSNIQGVEIGKPTASIKINEDEANFLVSSYVNNEIFAFVDGKLTFGDKSIYLNMDTCSFEYNNLLKWHTINPLNMKLDTLGLEIDNFVFYRDNAESVTVAGKINQENAENIIINVNNFPLDGLNTILPEDIKNLVDQFKGKIESLTINISDSLVSPKIDIGFSTSELIMNGMPVGSLNGKLHHENAMIKGNIDVTNSSKLMSIDVLQLPINLTISGGVDRLSSKDSMNIHLSGSSVPLELISPFVPNAIESLKGLFDVNLYLHGFLNDKIKYDGNARIKKSTFIAQANNLSYSGEGTIQFNSDRVNFDSLIVRNSPDDLTSGIAFVSGNITLNEFEINEFDINILSPQIKVLSRASIKSMPTLYGDFIISSYPSKIKFSGTMKTPFLSGDVSVLRADIVMPQATGSSISSLTPVKYEFVGGEKDTTINKTIDTTIKKVSTQIQPDKKELTEQSVNFADLLAYDLNVRFINPMNVTMELNQLGQVYAIIGTQDKSLPLHYVVERGKKAPELFGNDLILMDGSRLKYFRLFETSGKINFPTGSIDNPGINLIAEYNGQSIMETETRNFKVTMLITGTKDRPNLKLNYSINNVEGVGDSSDISQDALFLLLMGRKKDEFESGGKTGRFDFGEFGTSTASSLISKVTTELLQGTGVIKNAEINFKPGSFEIDKAELKLSGNFLGNLTWRVGGTIAEIAANNEFSIDIPIPFLENITLLNNALVQATTSTNVNQSLTKNQKIWEIKLKFGGSF